LTLQADPKETNGITLQNLVVGNQNMPAASLFDTIIVEGNAIAASRNVYPAFFNHLDQPSGHPSWTFENNVYSTKAASTSPQLASPCSSSRFPFVTGELYAGLGVDPTRYWANLQTAKVKASAMVTLFAVVQPIMSQTSQFMRGSYGSSPGLFAIGSPALKGKVTFFDHHNIIGTAEISGNGTLATLRIDHIDQGTHMFSAEYSDPPAAHFYNPLSFGGVSIESDK
jgi:hypothetical protein